MPRVDAEIRRLSQVKRDENGHVIRPVLTPRHLAVIDRYFENGFNKRDAMRYVGYSEGSVSGSVSIALFAREDMTAEIAWRREQIERRYEISEGRVMEELASMAFSSLGDLLVVQEDGQAYIDMTSLTTRQRAAIQEFTVDEYSEGAGEFKRDIKRVKLKFHNKLEALTLIMRKLGMLNDKKTVQHEISIVERLQAGRDRFRVGVEAPDGTRMVVEAE
jgi:hypothetical protein